MGNGYGPLVATYTALSMGGLAWRINSALNGAIPEDVHLEKRALDPSDAARVLQSLLQSTITIALLGNLVFNFFLLVALFTKTLFFGQLSLVETQKVVERLINYVLFKGLFLTWVVQPEMMAIALWLAWFAVLGFLKMFQGLARDRLERLNASPTATMLAHVRVFAVLVLVLLSDLFWMRLCMWVFKDTGTSTFMLLLFEPLSIAFDTLQAVVVHGMQLLDTWQRHSLDTSSHVATMQPSERSAAGAAWEWRGTVVRNWSFAMDIVSLMLALGHCVHIWWLRGLAFQVVDAVLFLNLRALLSAISKRIKGFMRLRTAMNTLQGALPDATQEELLAYEDDCAICKEPMARAKRLPCAHLFHLSCLRSWLDQGLAETYSCPTCRRPLFMGSSRISPPNTQGGQRFPEEVMTRNLLNAAGNRDGQIRQQSPTSPGSPVPLSSSDPLARQPWNAPVPNLPWRGGRVDPSWSHAVPGAAGEGEGPSSEASSGGIGRMQLMMRQLSGSGRGPAQPEDNGWGWWPFGRGTESVSVAGRRRIESRGLRRQGSGATGSRSGDLVPDIGVQVDPRMAAMVNMVREVLPHMPDELIVQDLRRTNSATATVNNLL
ncbi:E3 ubiquitin-protein ligase AMFR [Marchantia polymorpha subsp. ruderalis]|uniref:RING-type domain-containing protein n=2 Tax=Marchantia polymorpha TaxID=3197 RepID=A0A176WRG7_MARPO|nr:hypothetical protein AXG93_2587s1490 [Marchantia polymorpha subsp. ruderalis]PTQ26944.1 hypothetical protein MARPO_0259s0001 [Marchantia polymorpha]PTQ26945.1 hypothetical protein MARPO_0259s0001 [Marchantia polymorpha]PTQ29419.1 hypothetical protein MARPO_0141s0003 [Marchantia polymorpha]PTQ29420.1 hypothetical protein MARPO_0141s0003 [Marchantia polymorpha]|eukprot:PTQ26944.1 hypothetical protein MARPO_0259s0001 [Marchantia polymorpha]